MCKRLGPVWVRRSKYPLLLLAKCSWLWSKAFIYKNADEKYTFRQVHRRMYQARQAEGLLNIWSWLFPTDARIRCKPSLFFFLFFKVLFLFFTFFNYTPKLHNMHTNIAIIGHVNLLLFASAITSTGPVYLSDLRSKHPPLRQLRSSADSRILWSPSVNRLSRTAANVLSVLNWVNC